MSRSRSAARSPSSASGRGTFGRRQRSGGRSPYLAICLVTRSEPSSPAQLLKAYLHPCASVGYLMLVDSNRERHTLRLLRRLQAWLAQRKGIGLRIAKPMFDLAAGLDAAGPNGDALDVCGPCIPDFLLEAIAFNLVAHRRRSSRRWATPTSSTGSASSAPMRSCAG